MLYMLAMVVALVIVHEAAHILAALAFGAQFNELKPGFYGINPSVTLPEWFTADSTDNSPLYRWSHCWHSATSLLPPLLGTEISP